MQYTGEKKIKLKKIGSYDPYDHKDMFLVDNGMMMQFLLDNNYYKGIELNSHHIKRNNQEVNVLWKEMTQAERDSVIYKVVKEDDYYREKSFVDEFEYEGKTYVIEDNSAIQQWHCMVDTSYTVYEILPAFENNRIFKWTFNKKYKVYECKFTMGAFEFHCVRDNEDGVEIDVKYAKCDNRHRNRVTINTIYITNGSNDIVLEAIDKWKDEFINELSAM